ncbi:McrB family protein [Arcobacter porcinus]|uniref:5-methylcytosine-specific restriction enzyme B n=1 Tax=Arcobacter porcinus TaxID=1935204 RepID=A0ABX2YHD5_9BACT|nr:AAA family ATPase [Arcobacter porcinus]OCL90835.1 5-methylcytosine-specific restriction enzyme B [Arcobacter porcinus]
MRKLKDIYEGFDSFKDRFLKNKKSIFSDNQVFKKENLNKIIEGFAKNPDESGKSFDEKIKIQLGNATEVHELFAHIIWLWSLVASDMKQIGKIADINKWLDNDKKIDENFPYSFNHGIMSTGQYHKTNKPLELVYIIYFLQKVLDNPEIDYVEIIKKGLKDDIEPFEMSFENGTTRKVAMYNILLHLFKPEYYSSIASFNHKEKIVDFFSTQLEINFEKMDDMDDKYFKVKEECLEKYGDKYPYKWDEIYNNYDFNRLDFYHPHIEKLWKNEIDFESKNLILHGAPGTGKTYITEETIKTRKEVLGNIEYELVQFHPSYGYEDFIDGIKPVGLTENGQMKFELKNGIFKQMCIDAFKNLIESQNDKTKLKTYYFIADEINRAELSRVFGELLLCLEDDKRLRIVDGKIEGTKIKTQNSNLWEEKHAVVVEEKDNKEKEFYFGVPENIYFIGTMNDIDRSVDSFDMALRRRFVWKQYRCDYEAIENKYKDEKDIEAYITVCKNLNNHITTENNNGFNLSDSYELGQAYFMKPKRLTQKELDRVWIEHISPILKEYLRAEYSEKDIIGKLAEAQNIFKLK